MRRFRVVGCVVAVVAASALFWVLIEASVRRSPMWPHPVTSMVELEQLTGQNLPAGAGLIEGMTQRTPGEDNVWATFSMPPDVARAFLQEAPFDAESQTSVERLLTDQYMYGLTSWHPDQARTFIAGSGGYDTPLRERDSRTPVDDQYLEWRVRALAGLDDPRTATVYVYWIATMEFDPATR